MNKIFVTFVAAFAMATITTTGYAADNANQPVSVTPSVRTPETAAETAEKKREKERFERNMKAKSLPDTAHKSVSDASSAKKVKKIQDRNLKARENTKGLAPKEVPADPKVK